MRCERALKAVKDAQVGGVGGQEWVTRNVMVDDVCCSEGTEGDDGGVDWNDDDDDDVDDVCSFALEPNTQTKPPR
jgi:hypothetical protein